MPPSIRVPWVSPEVVEQILRIGKDREPRESCGVVLPDSRVVELRNSSSTPSNSFVITSEDLLDAINDYVDRSGVDPSELTRGHFIIWHTHPAGVVGPSAGDLRERLPGFLYVVITLPHGEAVQF